MRHLSNHNFNVCDLPLLVVCSRSTRQMCDRQTSSTQPKKHCYYMFGPGRIMANESITLGVDCSCG